MAFDWKPVIDGVVSIVNNIFSVSAEKKAKKAAQKAQQEASGTSVPDGWYLGTDGNLYPNSASEQTLATIQKKARVFGKEPDMSLYEKTGKDAQGNDLYRAKIIVKAASTGGKSNNLLGDIIGGIGNIVGGGKPSASGTPDKDSNKALDFLKYVPTVALLGGAGYGAYWVYKKYK